MRVEKLQQGSLFASEALPVELHIEAALMSKELETQRDEGAANLKLIERATAGVNQPLLEGPVGRRINIRI